MNQHLYLSPLTQSTNPTAFKEPKMPISIKSSKELVSIGNDNKQSNGSKQDKFDNLLQTKFPRSYISSRTGTWFLDEKDQLSDRHMHTLSGLAFAVVRVLAKSNPTVTIHVLAAVKKRVDVEVISLVDAVDTSGDGMMRWMIL